MKRVELMTRQEGTEEEGEEMARLRLDRTQNTDRDNDVCESTLDLYSF